MKLNNVVAYRSIDMLPLVLVLIFFQSKAIIPYCYLVYYCCCKNKTIKFLQKVTDFMRTFVSVIFPFLKKGKGTGNQSLTLFKNDDLVVELPNFVVYQLFYFSLYLFFTVLAVFCEEFFLQDYDHCIPGDNALQCFSIENETMDELIDCSKNSSSISVICYKFVFAFDAAFSSAAGVFVICTAEFVGIVTFLHLIYTTQCCKCCYYCVQIFTILILTLGDIILFWLLPYAYITKQIPLYLALLKLVVISGAAVIASYMPMFGFGRKQPTRVLPYDDESADDVKYFSTNYINSDI